MARHVNFGNNRHIPLGGILHQFAYFLLGVKSAVRLTVVRLRVASHHRLFSLRTHRSQPRVFLDFNAPALVVGQVPVKAVQPVQRQHVDEAAYRVGRHEVPCHVQVSASVAKAWRVFYLRGRNAYALRPRRSCGQCFTQGLHGVEEAGSRSPLHPHHFAVDAQRVLLLPPVLVQAGQPDAVALCGHRCHHEVQARGLLHILLQVFGAPLPVGVALGIDDEGAGCELKGAAARRAYLSG